MRMKRRLRNACLGLVAAAGAGQAHAAPAGVVRTTNGSVSGVAVPTGYVFKGIPYAAAPIGPLRWRSPEAPRRWEGVRQADAFGPPCAQAPLRGMTAVSDLSREDCLSLNLWTPGLSAGAKRPVMVWIHGGGFVNGSGTSPTYDGANFAAKGVVLVTLNYRLGVFGFLAHPSLTAESPRHSSGNYGMEDQVAALRWVKANIAAFGGDPANVTLFGQSAGGASVLDLVESPLAEALFAKAIVESGAAREQIAPAPLRDAEQRGAALVGARRLADLRALDMAEIFKLVQAAAPASARFGPSRDGYVLALRSAATFRRSGHVRPLLIGNNSREGLSVPQPDQFEAAIRRAFGSNANEALSFYGVKDGRARDADPILGAPEQQFATDSTFRCGAVETAHRHAEYGAPTWAYQFEQSVPGREKLGAAHSFEVPYVFGTLSSTGFSAANYGPADRQLSDLMNAYWANFAATGNPNGAGLPVWPAYNLAAKQYVRFSSALPHNVQPASDLRGAVCRLFPKTSQ